LPRPLTPATVLAQRFRSGVKRLQKDPTLASARRGCTSWPA